MFLGLYVPVFMAAISPAALPPVTLTNLLVCELRDRSATDEGCALLLLQQPLNPELAVQLTECIRETLRKKINQVWRIRKNLKSRKSTKKLELFLAKEFLPPTAPTERRSEDPPQVQQLLRRQDTLIKEVIYTKRKLNCADAERKDLFLQTELLAGQLATSEQVSAGHVQELAGLRCDMLELSDEMRELELKQNVSQNELGKAKTKLSTLSTRNIHKRFKIRDNKISVLQCELASLKSTIQEQEVLDGEVSMYKDLVANLQHQKCNLQVKVSRLKKVANSLTDKSEHQDENMVEYEYEIKILTEKVNELMQLNNLVESNHISTFEDGKYINDMRECCMLLMTECNVSTSKLPSVIDTVLKKLTGKEMFRTPSQPFLSRLYTEARIVASQQIVGTMLTNYDATDMTGNVLHQDATTKFHQHWEGIQVTNKDGTSLSIGLKQVAGGDANTYVMAFKDTIKDLTLAVTSSSSDADKKRSQLITSLKSLMSDQCSTNGLFNKAIHDIREGLLPAVIENFDQLPETEKSEIAEMGTFACRMHLLANLAPAADKALAAYELSVCEDPQNPESYQTYGSGTHRLVRSAAKAFTQRGCDKAGVHSYFETFLRGRGQENHLVTFHGHRFNIAFYDAAAVYYHRKDITEFLDAWPNPNGLLKAVAFDVKQHVFLAGVRALGMVHKLVTEPLQSLIKCSGSILDLNKDLFALQSALSEWMGDGAKPFSGAIVFNEERVHLVKDKLFDALFASTEDAYMDSLTQVALELISTEMLILLERQATSQLPEGELWDPSTKMLEIAKNVPKHNIISERDMAILDNLLRSKPAASATFIETTVLWVNNKPSIWLDSLTLEERDRALNEAREKAPAYRKLVKERQQLLKEQLQKRLKCKQQEKAEKEGKAAGYKLQLSREIMDTCGGVWKKDEIHRHLEKIAREVNIEKTLTEREGKALVESQSREVLLKQLKFNKVVIGAKGARSLFQASCKGKKLSSSELLENLRNVLDLNEHKPEENQEEKVVVYKEQDERDMAVHEKKGRMMAQLFEARKKRKTKQQQCYLPKLIADPQLLVGKTVQHKCVAEGESDWFDGIVLSIEKSTKDPAKTVYNIRYNESPTYIMAFSLIAELRKGNLIIKD